MLLDFHAFSDASPVSQADEGRGTGVRIDSMSVLSARLLRDASTIVADVEIVFGATHAGAACRTEVQVVKCVRSRDSARDRRRAIMSDAVRQTLG